MEKQYGRRGFLRAGLLGGAGLAGTMLLAPQAKSAENLVCRATPPQTKGPFYPVNDQLDKDNDLTTVAGSGKVAKGQIIYVEGQVIDKDCQPVEGALVEIWQACETGKYNHPNDPNTAALDPDFQYFGKAVTDKNGAYIFKTIIPGAYPADRNWMRPPHIHYRVLKRGYKELVTQLYFAGDALNDKDLILQAIPPEDRGSVIATLVPADPKRYGPNTKIGTFNLTLLKPGQA